MFEQFLKYQQGEIDEYPSYEKAFHEITVTKKKISHWIWYIVPYDIPSRTHQDLFVLKETEVQLYVDNKILKNNYINIMNAIYDLLKHTNIYEYDTVIPRVDLKKIYGSATLFKRNVNSSEKEIIYICEKMISLLNEYVSTKEYDNKYNKRKTLNLIHQDLLKKNMV